MENAREGAIVAAACSILLWQASAVAQPKAANANAAVPDFSGSWTSTIRWKFEVPPSGPGPIVDDPKNVHHGHVASADGKGDQEANAWVGDITNPILKPWAADVIEKRNEAGLKEGAGVQTTAEATCRPGGVPNILTRAEPVFLLQTPKEVTILYQRDEQVRHVYLNREHSKTPGKSWYGESVGHYEGDTLIIDTVGMNDKSTIDYFGTPHTDAIHVVERYRVIDGGKTLEVGFTVDDPKTFTVPWSGFAHYRHGAQPVALESICAEVSVDMFTKKPLPIPIAVRADF